MTPNLHRMLMIAMCFLMVIGFSIRAHSSESSLDQFKQDIKDTQCYDYKLMLEKLASIGEKPVAMGIYKDGEGKPMPLIVFASEVSWSHVLVFIGTAMNGSDVGCLLKWGMLGKEA